MKSSGFKDAPPTNTPSTFGIDIISAAFVALTLAPYKIGVPSNPIDFNVSAISLCASAISVSVGVRPAPIAQRGSYAIIIFLHHLAQIHEPPIQLLPWFFRPVFHPLFHPRI